MAESVQIVVEAQDLASNVLKTIAGVLTGDFKSAAVAVGAAFAGAVAAIGDLTNAAAEAQVSQERFNALVEASPLADFKDQMIDYANTLSKVTRFEDENILEAEGMLATYQTISKETFPDVLNASLDLAEFMKTDAANAAETLGRSFSDIAGGSLTMLYRQKLLTQAQKDQAEEMAKAGDAAGAQAFVLDILNGKIGNLAETMGGTFAGQQEIFKNTINNIKEELGAKLLPMFQPVMNKMLELAEKYAPMISEAFEKYIVPAVSWATEKFSAFLDFLSQGDLFARLGDWAKGIDWNEVSNNLADGIDSIDWAMLGEKTREGVVIIGEFAKTVLVETDWLALGQSIAGGLLNFLAGLTGNKSYQEVIDVWVNNIMQAFKIAWQLEKIGMQKAKEFIESVRAGLMSGVEVVTAPIYAWATSISVALSSLGGIFYARFMAAGQFALNAINNIKGTLVTAVRNLIAAVKAAITEIKINVTASIPDFSWIVNAIKTGIDLIKTTIKNAGSIAVKVGTNIGGNLLPTGFAEGTNGWQTVPAGYPNDSYPVFLTSGERFAVVPSGQSSAPMSAAGAGGMTVNITYAPTFSAASRDEFVSNITPVLNEWYRRRLAS